MRQIIYIIIYAFDLYYTSNTLVIQ